MSGTEPQRTPLAGRHESLGARMVDFHGWWMPVQYEGIVLEHTHTRTAASAWDVSHMGTLVIRGAAPARDLDRVVTCNVTTLRVGRCRYGLLLNESGGIEDDLLVYRVRDREFWLVVNASTIDKDAELVRERLSSSSEFEDTSAATAMVAVQGPRSREALTAALDADISSLRYYRCAVCRGFGHEMLVSRTGYTGELGYELCFDAAAAEEVWDAVLRLPHVKPAGLGARDTLRLEMSMPLYGADLTPEHTPVEAGLMAAVDLGKAFVGRDAVDARFRDGPRERLIGFAMPDRRAARSGQEILHQDEVVGAVTSGSFAPSLGHAIGMGYVAPQVAEPGRVLTMEFRGKAVDARVVDRPFYRQGSARA